MGPRKSSDSATETGYPVLLYKLCKEEDVLIIPHFVTQLTNRQLEAGSPTKGRTTVQDSVVPPQQKSKDSKSSEKSGSERFGSEKFGSDKILHSESKWEDSLACGNIPPPQVAIVYENPEDKDTPVAVICRNIYVEFALVSAIGKSLKSYPTLSCLKIENCCISREIAEALALLLAEDSGKWISDLSLDGNEGISDVVPLFVKLSTGLRYLSLERCSLDDEDMDMLGEALSFGDGKDHKLQCLNLSMNKIGSMGLCHLADALRTNRNLISLSLAGNQITDEGVACLTEVLQKFPLTCDEIFMRRKRVFNAILRKKDAVEKHLEELKLKAEIETSSVKKHSDPRNMERMGRRIRCPDGRIRCIPIKDLKTKSEPQRLNSGEKFLGKNRSGTEEGPAGVEVSPSEMLEIMRQVEAEMLPDRHPFINEVQMTEDGAWCHGCWSLANINLAFNYLTDRSVERFIEVVQYQSENFSNRIGLSRLVLVPGNLFRDNLPEYQRLQTSIVYRATRKDTSDERTLGAASTTARAASSKLTKKLTDPTESGMFPKT